MAAGYYSYCVSYVRLAGRTYDTQSIEDNQQMKALTYFYVQIILILHELQLLYAMNILSFTVTYT
jgi:hypothetical protein